MWALQTVPSSDRNRALAFIIGTLGSQEDWSSDTLDAIVDFVAPIVGKAKLPSPFDQSDDELAFWQSVMS